MFSQNVRISAGIGYCLLDLLFRIMNSIKD